MLFLPIYQPYNAGATSYLMKVVTTKANDTQP